LPVAERRTDNRVRIREIQSADDAAFDRAYQLLHDAFPRSELLPRREWVYLMKERTLGLWTDINWHLLIAERAGRMIGAASGSYVGNLNVGVIGYIALKPGARSHGVGPRLRKRLRALFERDAREAGRGPVKALVGEVHLNNPWLGHLVRREGAIALDFPYYQPSLRGRRDPVPMVLYYQPLDRPRTWLAANELKKLLYTLWRRPYRVSKPLRREAFRRMMRALEGRRRIGQRELPPPRPKSADRAAK
jgi:hypothetical protein